MAFTGDLVSIPNKENYNAAYKLMSRLVRKIKEITGKTNIKSFFVPGNHDIVCDKNQLFDNKSIDDVSLKHQEEKLTHFYDFMKKWYKGSKLPYVRFFDVVSSKYNVGNNTIRFNLINTAPFSGLAHEDKEKHYVKPQSIEKITNDSDLCITLMHHSYDWFHEKVKNTLEKKIKENTDVLLLGHEHNQEDGKYIQNHSPLYICKSGAFDYDEYNNNTSFHVISYDFTTQEIDISLYNWDKTKQLYEKKNVVSKEKIVRGIEKIYNSDFTSSLMKDDKVQINMNFKDYFVFPKIKNELDNESIQINNLNILKNYLLNNKYVSVSGAKESGRTSLLKMIYLELRKEKYTLFLNKDSVNNTNIKKAIRDAIESQYYEDYEMDEYNNLPKEEKAIIIDDFDLIKNGKVKDALIQYLKYYFDIIIFSAEKNDSTNIKEELKNKYHLDISQLKVYSFTKEQRKELTEKIIQANNKELDKDYIIEIENNIKMMPMLRTIGNSFLVNFINLSILQGNLLSEEAKKDFNVLFETTLRNCIITNTKKGYVDEYIKALELISMYSHFNKKSRISLADITTIISDYNEEYGKNISVNEFINTMKEARIFMEYDNNYLSFVNKMYLAYFVARGICFEINTNSNTIYFETVLNEVCFGINGDILLFMIYLAQNIKLLDYIKQSVNKISLDWDRLSFEHKNVKYLYNVSGNNDLSISDGDVQKANQIQSEIEIKEIENYNLTCEDIYDYTDEELFDELNKISSVLKGVELMSRGLQSFSANLTINKQRELLCSSYDALDKILYKLLHTIDVDLDSFIEGLSAQPEIKKEKIKETIIRISLSLIHGMYRFTSDLCINRQTADSLLKIADESMFDSISGVLFRLALLNSTGKNDKFMKEIHNLLSKSNDAPVLFIAERLVAERVIIRDLGLDDRNKLISIYNNNAPKGFKIAISTSQLNAMSLAMNK